MELFGHRVNASTFADIKVVGLLKVRNYPDERSREVRLCGRVYISRTWVTH